MDTSYCEALAGEYATAAMRVRGVVSLYQLGYASTPELSDLDLIVVVDDSLEDADSLSVRRVFESDPRAMDLFAHDVALMSVGGFADLPVFYYVSALTHLAGADLGQPACPDRFRRHAWLSNLVEFALPRIHLLHRLIAGSRSPRSILLRASAARHTSTLLRQLGVRTEASTEFDECDANMRARGQWDLSSAVAHAHRAGAFLEFALREAAALVPCAAREDTVGALRDISTGDVTVFSGDLKSVGWHYRSAPSSPRTLVVDARLGAYFCSYPLTGGVVGRSASVSLQCRADCPHIEDSSFLEYLTVRASALNRRHLFLTHVDAWFSDIKPRPGFSLL